jgi:hypothetical protein
MDDYSQNFQDQHSLDVIPVKTNDGTQFLLEIRRPQGMENVSALGGLPMEGFMESIRSLSDALVTAIKFVSPNKFSIEFGVEATLEAGKLLALLCKGSGKANLTIKLEWEKPKEGD